MNRPALWLAAILFFVALQAATIADEPSATKNRSPFRGRKSTATKTPVPSTVPSTMTAPPRRNPVSSQIPNALRTPRTSPPFDVAPIDRERRPSVAAHAAKIDALLAKIGSGHPGDVRRLDDAGFVRRAYLSLNGRIPTAAETLSFINSKDPDKRANLVDDLLESPDWVSNFYNLWAATLRLKEEPQFDLDLTPYLDWVKRSIADNRPYDEWVHTMLTADGKLWESPAVGYQLRDQGMPLAYMSNTLRVFLGTQLGCAECHDHPFAPWTQRQFYELAAFTAGTSTGREPTGGPSEAAQAVHALVQRNRKAISDQIDSRSAEGWTPDPVDAGQFEMFMRLNASKVRHDPLEIALPKNYRYDNGRPGESIPPRLPWGDVPADAADAAPRSQFAAWVTSAENPQFSRTIANRLWRFCFGVGIVEPIDDFGDGNPPSHPELLDALAELFVDLDFDMREYVRVLVATDAWQRRAVTYDPTSTEPFPFQAPALRRMTAEQLWDSMLTLFVRNRWVYQRPAYERYSVLNDFDIVGNDVDFDVAFSTYEAYRDQLMKDALQRSRDEAVLFLNYPLAPASELRFPLHATHLLIEFGIGDRETIDGGRTVPTLSQILELLHGNLLLGSLDDGSVLMDAVASNPANRAVDVLFMSILSRLPDAGESEFVKASILAADSIPSGIRDVAWALLNTREFLFIQ